MSSCHAPTRDATSSHPRQTEALRALEDFVAERRASHEGVTDLAAFERELHERVLAVEREAMAVELAKLDVDAPVVRIDGVLHRRAVRCEETYWGVAGPIRVERTLYSDRSSGGPAACPLELRAGIVEGRWTPWAAEQAAWAVAHLTPQEAESLFERLGGMCPSKSSLDRLPKKLGERWEAGRIEFEEEVRQGEEVPAAARAVMVSLDGVLLPMKGGQRAGKRAAARASGKRTKGPAGYREAGCATLSFYDAEGNRLSTIRIGRMPEQKKRALKEMLVAELLHVLEQRPDLIVVKVADGARDNWEFLHEQLPPGTEVVDFYHAAEHLRAALVVAYGETNSRGIRQFEKLRHILREDDDGVEKVIRALRYLRDKHPRRSKIQRELEYFRRNRQRMQYASVAAANLPIGSGVTEAACKTLVSQRMKRSGMRWGEEGGQAILTLRSLFQSDRFDRAWRIVLGTYTAAVTVPDNVVPMRAARPASGVSA